MLVISVNDMPFEKKIIMCNKIYIIDANKILNMSCKA